MTREQLKMLLDAVFDQLESMAGGRWAIVFAIHSLQVLVEQDAVLDFLLRYVGSSPRLRAAAFEAVGMTPDQLRVILDVIFSGLELYATGALLKLAVRALHNLATQPAVLAMILSLFNTRQANAAIVA